MAPRKDASATQQAAGIESFDLPKALVTRLAKSALPPEAKLQKDTVTALVRSATVFINYIAATAQDIAATRSRRTIASADVLAALEVVALDDLVPLLERELEGYRGEKGSKSKAGGDAKGKGKEVARTDQQEHEQDDDSGEEGEDDAPEEHEDGAPEENEDDAPEENEEEPEPEPLNDEDADEDIVPEDEGALEDDVPSDADIPDSEPHDEKEIEDTLALEAEELLRDARGLEARGASADVGADASVEQ